MASLVSALDTEINIQYGENNHIEYKWSNIQQEKILQISFQLVRTPDINKKQELAKKFMECFTSGNNEDKIVLLKLLAHTRDIENGKGEYALTYSILKELYNYDKNLAVTILILFVEPTTTASATTASATTASATTTTASTEQDVKPIGCWKDIKYFCNEIKKTSIELPIELPIELLEVFNSQVRNDNVNMNLKKNVH